MENARRYRAILVALLASLAAECSKSPTAPTAQSGVTTVTVGVTGNAAPVLAPQDKLQLWALATRADGKTEDVTNTAIWQSSNPAVATVSREGVLSAAAEGIVDVKASVDQVFGSLRAEIRRRGCDAATLSPTSMIFNAFGSSSATINLMTPLSDCRWTATSDADWLLFNNSSHVYDPGKSGSGTLTYLVSANNFPQPRNGHIVVLFTDGGQLIHSVAEEPPISCSYVATSGEAYFSAAGGSGAFDVTTTPGDCRWTATAHYDSYGIRLTSIGGGTGNARVTYSVGPNPSTYAREGNIQIAGLSGANPPAIHKIHIAGR